jgi:acyl carrier protein
MPNVRETLQEIFRDIFNEPDLVLSDDMDSGSIDDWDSLRHIDMIIAAEKALGVRLATGEIARLKQPGQNVGTFIALLERKTGTRE